MTTLDPQQLADVVAGAGRFWGRLASGISKLVETMSMAERPAAELSKAKPSVPTETAAERMWKDYGGRKSR